MEGIEQNKELFHRESFTGPGGDGPGPDRALQMAATWGVAHPALARSAWWASAQASHVCRVGLAMAGQSFATAALHALDGGDGPGDGGDGPGDGRGLQPAQDGLHGSSLPPGHTSSRKMYLMIETAPTPRGCTQMLMFSRAILHRHLHSNCNGIYIPTALGCGWHSIALEQPHTMRSRRQSR
jgi:hypothetical protein